MHANCIIGGYACPASERIAVSSKQALLGQGHITKHSLPQPVCSIQCLLGAGQWTMALIAFMQVSDTDVTCTAINDAELNGLLTIFCSSLHATGPVRRGVCVRACACYSLGRKFRITLP